MQHSVSKPRRILARWLIAVAAAGLWVSHFATDATLAVLRVRRWTDLRAERVNTGRADAPDIGENHERH